MANGAKIMRTCHVNHCYSIDLTLADQTLVRVCAHELAHSGEKFATLIASPEVQEEKALQIAGIYKTEFLHFLSCTSNERRIGNEPDELPEDAARIANLIRMACILQSRVLTNRLLAHLNDQADQLSVHQKIILTESAFEHKTQSPVLLEACLRLCVNESVDKIAALKPTDVVLATIKEKKSKWNKELGIGGRLMRFITPHSDKTFNQKPAHAAPSETLFQHPGCCLSPGCEAELKLEDGSVFVCRHRLAIISEYFNSLFARNSQEYAIENVLTNQMLQFLQCSIRAPSSELPLRPLPPDATGIFTLVKLSDRFDSRWTIERVINHLQSTDRLKTMNTDCKLALLAISCNYRDRFPEFYPACVQLCADVSLEKLKTIKSSLQPEVIAEVYETALHYMCGQVERRERQVEFLSQQVEELTVEVSHVRHELTNKEFIYTKPCKRCGHRNQINDKTTQSN